MQKAKKEATDDQVNQSLEGHVEEVECSCQALVADRLTLDAHETNPTAISRAASLLL